MLRRLAKLPASVVLDNAANYTEFNSSMAENAVLPSLVPSLGGDIPYYWSPDSRAEIEFIVQDNERIIPIEVKAENCVSGSSLTVYNERYHSDVRIRFSFLSLQSNDGLLTKVPILAVEVSQRDNSIGYQAAYFGRKISSVPIFI